MRTLLVALCLFIVGCGNKPAPGTPAPPQSVEFRVHQGIGILAEVNLAAVKRVAQARKDGQISDAMVLSILDWTDRVAAAQKAAIAILQRSGDPTTKIAAVQGLIKSLGLPPEYSSPTVAGLVAGVTSTLTMILEAR
jgi:hypothetical protein